jgi:hypothetical protein
VNAYPYLSLVLRFRLKRLRTTSWFCGTHARSFVALERPGGTCESSAI